MRAYINDKRKSVYLVTNSPADACHLGFYFALNFPKLVDEGWHIYCAKSFPSLYKLRDAGEVSSAYELSRILSYCDHSCTYHKAVE